MKNGILKGKGLNGMNDNMEHDGYSGYRENYSTGEPHLSSSLPSQHEIGFTRHN